MILAAWLVVRTSLLNLFLRQQPAMAAMIAPGDPRIPLERAMTEFLTRGGMVSPGTKRAAFEAARSVPLAEQPFILAALDALVRNDTVRGHQLLLEARRRKPRSSITRLLLLDRFLRNGQIDDATTEMAALVGLAPEATGPLMGELSRLIQNPRIRPRLEKALRENPRFREPLLLKLAEDRVDADLILEISRNVPPPPGATGLALWQSRLITLLVEQNQVPRAYDLWRTFSAPKAPAKKIGLYDGGFQGLPGTGPFNWNFPASTAGVAERTPERRLQVEYYGRDNAELASQLLTLPPGAYRLSFRVEGDAEGEGSRLSWKVACHPDNKELFELVLRKVTYAPRAMAGTFTVPAGCPAQWLRLMGSAGEFAKAQHVEIGAVQVAAAR